MIKYINCKILLLGESGCGKSSIVRRFINNDFDEHSELTIGTTFYAKKMHNHGLKFEILDISSIAERMSIIYEDKTHLAFLIFMHCKTYCLKSLFRF